jgi:hypothetical protein
VIPEFRPVGLSEPLKRSWTIVVISTAEKSKEIKAISIALQCCNKTLEL